MEMFKHSMHLSLFLLVDDCFLELNIHFPLCLSLNTKYSFKVPQGLVLAWIHPFNKQC